jgi:4-oxalocrotonate tautomerase
VIAGKASGLPGAFLFSDLNERRPAMPIVNIMVTREGSTSENDSVTAEQKGRLIKGVSQLLLEVLNKPLDSTFVTIQEIELENWGWGGLPVPELRRQRTGRAKTSD